MQYLKLLRVLPVAATALLFGFAATTLAADKTKVGFVYVGPIGDHGWSYQHHQGPRGDQEGVRRQGGDDLRREGFRRP